MLLANITMPSSQREVQLKKKHSLELLQFVSCLPLGPGTFDEVVKVILAARFARYPGAGRDWTLELTEFERLRWTILAGILQRNSYEVPSPEEVLAVVVDSFDTLPLGTEFAVGILLNRLLRPLALRQQLEEPQLARVLALLLEQVESVKCYNRTALVVVPFTLELMASPVYAPSVKRFFASLLDYSSKTIGLMNRIAEAMIAAFRTSPDLCLAWLPELLQLVQFGPVRKSEADRAQQEEAALADSDVGVRVRLAEFLDSLADTRLKDALLCHFLATAATAKGVSLARRFSKAHRSAFTSP
jgi:hypothetical protein